MGKFRFALSAYGGTIVDYDNINGASNGNARVFFNILVFDENFNFLDVVYQQIPQDGNWDLIDINYIAKQGCYVYAFAANEDAGVALTFIDDVTITLTPSAIAQSNDYYPYGLAFNSFTRQHAVGNRWKFQKQEHIDDLGVNWDSFKWRNYQPDIGRFFNVDPLADKYASNSLYAFSENSVVSSIEFEGLEGVDIKNTASLSYKFDGSVGAQMSNGKEVLKFDLKGANGSASMGQKIDLGGASISPGIKGGVENGEATLGIDIQAEGPTQPSSPLIHDRSILDMVRPTEAVQKSAQTPGNAGPAVGAMMRSISKNSFVPLKYTKEKTMTEKSQMRLSSVLAKRDINRAMSNVTRPVYRMAGQAQNRKKTTNTEEKKQTSDSYVDPNGNNKH